VFDNKLLVTELIKG